MMKKKLVAAALIALTLTGCDVIGEASTEEVFLDGRYEEVHKTLTDGRTVVCVGRSNGGLSCDWDNAR